MSKSKIFLFVALILIVALGAAAVYYGYKLSKEAEETEELPETGQQTNLPQSCRALYQGNSENWFTVESITEDPAICDNYLTGTLKKCNAEFEAEFTTYSVSLLITNNTSDALSFTVTSENCSCPEARGDEDANPECGSCGNDRSNCDYPVRTFTIQPNGSYTLKETLSSLYEDASGNLLPCGSYQIDFMFDSVIRGTKTIYPSKGDCAYFGFPNVEAGDIVNGWIPGGLCGTGYEEGDPQCTPQVVETCGNGTCDTGETCDGTKKCLPTTGTLASGICRATGTTNECTYCGDGVKQPTSGEECDDGNTVNTDSCSNTCKNVVLPTCGDGTCNTGESCDGTKKCLPTTGTLASGICRTNCSYCGDGEVDSSEDCDDGNTVDDDSCSNTCETPAGTPAFSLTKTSVPTCSPDQTYATIKYTITAKNTSTTDGHIDYVQDTYDSRYQSTWLSAFNPTPDSHTGNVLKWDNDGAGYDIAAGQSKVFNYTVTLTREYWGTGTGNSFVPTEYTNTVILKPEDLSPIQVIHKTHVECVPETGIFDNALGLALTGLLLVIAGAVVLRYREYTYKYLLPVENASKNIQFYLTSFKKKLFDKLFLSKKEQFEMETVRKAEKRKK